MPANSHQSIDPPASEPNPWLTSACFLSAWLFPALMGFYLKWYMMADQGGFAKETRSMGLPELNFFERVSFFRGELLYGALLIPIVLFILNRYLPPRAAAALTGLSSLALTFLLGIQLLSLKELGRFSSTRMFGVAVSWGWHEPGSNVHYLFSKETLALLLAIVGIGVAIAWAMRRARRPATSRQWSRFRIAAEIYVFAILGVVLLSLKSDVPPSPYQENSFVRASTSLWKENAVETGEFSGLDLQRTSGLASADFSGLSAADLITQYRQLTNAPAAERDRRYFGKEPRANVLFFILETTPEKYLPVGADLKQFPHLNSLQHNSFVATRHYTTFPITRSAVFSIFSSWYPVDDPGNAFDSPSWDSTDDFLRRLSSTGYETAVFSPLRAPGIPDAALFEAVRFSSQIYPDAALTSYDKQASWQQARISADLSTLHLLESRIDQWASENHPFAAAFLPQIAHSPYPDGKSGDTAAELQARGQAILATEDAWLGELLELLQKDRQLDHTIIVVVGDHGLRTISENPDMRRGTIDETAFHVPLLIYAPRTLNQTLKIPWITSHIDLVPTLLDLLGVKGNRDSEQGTPIWDPALADRTTFFFAKPMFGADGYASQGHFFMWHYFSDTVYEKSSAEFEPSDIVPRHSATAQEVTGKLSKIIGLEKAWHRKFAAPSFRSREKSAVVANSH